MTPFKIGSIYRNTEGELVRLSPMDIHYDDRRCQAMFPGESFALARSLANNNACGYIRLCNGLFVGRQVWEKDYYSLKYGELNAQGEPIAPTFYSRIDADYRELKSAAALMEWLGKHMPNSLAHVRSFAGHNDFHSYMRGLTGVTQERFDSHDHACAAYLDALTRKFAPTFYCAAETIKPAVPKAMLSVTSDDLFYDRMAEALSLPPLASAAAWLELGRAIAPRGIPRGTHDGIVIYGIEATYVAAETLKPDAQTLAEIAQAWQREVEKACNTIIRRSLNTTELEKARPRLTWADSKAADPFAGYVTTRDTATPDHAYSHYLTRVADAGAQTPPVCGSAWLVVR